MNEISMSQFNVIHRGIIYRAVSVRMEFDENTQASANGVSPKFLDVVALNEDNNLIVLFDEAWTFQFVTRKEWQVK